MKKLLLLLILLCLSLFSFSQKKKPPVSSGIKVPVIIKWAEGEVSYLKVVRTEENVAKNEYFKVRTESDVRLRVLEKTDTSYTMEWTYTTADAVVEDYQLRGAVIRMANEEKIRGVINKLLESSEESALGMKVIYTTNEYGEFQEIINREDVRQQYKKSFTNLCGVLTADLPAAQRDSVAFVFNLMAEIIVSDPDFGLTFEDIQLLHTAYGYEFEPGITQEMIGAMQSPFNDEEYAVDMELKMSKYSSENKNCTVEGKIKLNEEVMQQYLADFLASMKENGYEGPLESEKSMEVNSEIKLDIDLNYGWVYQASETTLTKEDHDVSTKTLQITLRL